MPTTKLKPGTAAAQMAADEISKDWEDYAEEDQAAMEKALAEKGRAPFFNIPEGDTVTFDVDYKLKPQEVETKFGKRVSFRVLAPDAKTGEWKPHDLRLNPNNKVSRTFFRNVKQGRAAPDQLLRFKVTRTGKGMETAYDVKIIPRS